jgi:transglutaminase superfamily protein
MALTSQGMSFRKFLRLEPSQQRLHLRAALLLGWLSVALRFSTRLAVPKCLLLRPAGPRPRKTATPPDTIARAITRAARHIPGATCLVQAITLCRLLDREGYDSVLRVGVQPPSAGRLEAHAWVECEGEIILGGRNSADLYTALMQFHDNRIHES